MADGQQLTTYGLAIDPTKAEAGSKRTTAALNEIQRSLDAMGERITKASDQLDQLGQAGRSIRELDVAMRTLKADFAAGEVGATQYVAAMEQIRGEAIALRREAGSLAGTELAAFQRIMQTTGAPATQTARAMQTLNRTFAQTAGAALMLPGPLGRIAVALGRLAGPGGWIGLAAGSVAGLIAAYRGLTRESREQAQEAEQRIERWRKEREAVSATYQVYADLARQAERSA